MEAEMANSKSANRITREYVRNAKRIAQLQERNNAIKDEVLANYPEGIATPYGTWQTFSEGTRISFERKSIESLVNALVMEGNAEVARRILEIRNESTTKGGVRFLTPKE